MNTNQSSTQAVEAPPANQSAGAELTAGAKLTALAWGIILIVSIPQIILRLFVPAATGEANTPIWLALTQVVVLAVLWALTWVWPAMKPLRGFILALLALFVGMFLIYPIMVKSAAWANWVKQASWGVSLVVSMLMVHLFPVVLMALTLIGSGIGRRELFLVRGNPNASAQPSRLLFMKKAEPWTRVALKFLPVYIIIAVSILWIQLRPDLSQISQALIYLPAILIAAAINASAEEFEFRSMPLARLLPVLGKQQPIMITAVLWGFLHYFGNPGGLPGVLLVWYLGYIFAKSMIETRGFVWAFLIHLVGDTIIYAFWAMSV